MPAKQQIIDGLDKLRVAITNREPGLEAVVHRTSVHNAWFTRENIYRALDSMAQQFLDSKALEQWMANYPVPVENPSRIGLIMAGNLPAVGFHDLLAVIASGHLAQIKLSEKDPYLIPWMIQSMSPFIKKRIAIVPRLKDFDAVIATGSNNSARYFNRYFADYPHVIRRNRNSVAVLSGEETPKELAGLAVDIFSYFGLGCRNVSKIYLPEGYDFDPLISALAPHRELINHSKYKNNIDYNAAVHILNKVPNISLPHLTLVEREAIISRIGSLHYTYYQDLGQLRNQLDGQAEEIQCIVTGIDIEPLRIPVVSFGETQCPMLTDYADGVDTMQFLSSL